MLTSQEDCSIDSLKGSLSVLMVKLTGSQSWEWEGKNQWSHSTDRLTGTIRSTWCSEARAALCSRKDRSLLIRLTQWSHTPHTPQQKCPHKQPQPWCWRTWTSGFCLRSTICGTSHRNFKKFSVAEISAVHKPSAGTFLYDPADGCRGRPLPRQLSPACLILFTDAVSRNTPAPFQQV